MVTATTAQAKLPGELWIERSEQTRSNRTRLSDGEITAILRGGMKRERLCRIRRQGQVAKCLPRHDCSNAKISTPVLLIAASVSVYCQRVALPASGKPRPITALFGEESCDALAGLRDVQNTIEMTVWTMQWRPIDRRAGFANSGRRAFDPRLRK